MGYFETFCLACGGPCVEPSLDYEYVQDRHERSRIKKMQKRLEQINMSWIREWIAITKNGIFRGTPDIDFPASLDTDKVECISGQFGPEEKEVIWCANKLDNNVVYAFHESCWNVIAKPTFAELEQLRLKRDDTCNCVADESVYAYSGLMNQEFDYADMKPSLVTYLNDPLENQVSAQNVITTWEKVKMVTIEADKK